MYKRQGETKDEPKSKMIDYSDVKADEYGGLKTTLRGAVQTATFEYWHEALKTEAVRLQLHALRGGKNAVWIGDEESRLGLIVYGYLQSSEDKITATAGPKRGHTFGKLKVTGVL